MSGQRGNCIRNGFLIQVISVSMTIGGGFCFFEVPTKKKKKQTKDSNWGRFWVWEEIDSMELEFFYLPKTIKKKTHGAIVTSSLQKVKGCNFEVLV